ncbi:MAG: hypothetical protein LBI80_03035 [Endomicrobium sp.]|nr:hypothetical protein [Endomicrobium sp.]
MRVRSHNNVARIKTDENGFDIFNNKIIREEIYNKSRDLGFIYVSIDILGYRTGNMNETIKSS